MKKSWMAGHGIALALAAFSLTLFGGQANALPINSPVPSNAYIVYNGLEWAWGGPCAYSGGCYATGDLSYQGTQGWSLPSAADMAMVDAADSSDPGAFANLFLNNPGGNVPANGTDPVSGAFFAAGGNAAAGSCASPYFDTAAAWCDAGDGLAGDWAGSARGDFYAEQLYVRSGAVPEPSTWAMMLIGLFGVAALSRSRRTRGVALA